MIKEYVTKYMALLLLTGSVFFVSCLKQQKEVFEELDTEQVTANDNSLLESNSNDIDLIGSQVSENQSLTTFKTGDSAQTSPFDRPLAGSCATVNGFGTKTVVVNFGTAGCVGSDGRIRTGQLTYNFSASSPNTSTKYRNPGFSMTVSSQNYVVDGDQININNKTVTNTTPANISKEANPGINLTWSMSENISIVKADGKSISWNSRRTEELLNTNKIECYKGQGSAIDWTAAVLQITGSTSGVNEKGENYSSVSTKLIKDFTCIPDKNRPHRHPFVSGTIAYKPGNRPLRLIDFGNASACDFLATLNVNNKTYTITVP